MGGMNHVAFQGNLTRDPDYRATKAGTGMCNFTIANNRKFKNKAGSEMEEVAFLDCTAWQAQADLIRDRFSKGDAIMIEGRMKTESWEDKVTGQKRSKLKCIVEKIHFVGGGDSGGSRKKSRDEEREPVRTGKGEQGGLFEDNEDDIPF